MKTQNWIKILLIISIMIYGIHHILVSEFQIFNFKDLSFFMSQSLLIIVLIIRFKKNSKVLYSAYILAFLMLTYTYIQSSFLASKIESRNACLIDEFNKFPNLKTNQEAYIYIGLFSEKFNFKVDTLKSIPSMTGYSYQYLYGKWLRVD